jgi:hypothetical protein
VVVPQLLEESQSSAEVDKQASGSNDTPQLDSFSFDNAKASRKPYLSTQANTKESNA